MATSAVFDGPTRLSYRGPPPILIGKVLGVAVAVIGLMVLAGWLLGIPALISLGPGWLPMRAGTALGLLLSGFGLMLASAPPAAWTRPARLALGAAVLTLGAAALAGSAFPGGAWTPAGPGRPSLVSALNFTLVGAALLVLDAGNGWRVRPTESLSLAMGLLAFVGLESYVFGANPLSRRPLRPSRRPPPSASSRSPSACSSSARRRPDAEHRRRRNRRRDAAPHAADLADPAAGDRVGAAGGRARRLFRHI